ncbi:unnamed protein product [Lathyrus sativus]|nr:unnamed protein product [Lathyrus sativus]
MNIVTYNIRGCCILLKRRRISQTLQRGNADICLIQESKVTHMEDGIAHSIWRNSDMGWSALNSNGRSGGIITLWNRSKVSALFSFCGAGYLGIQFLWKNQNLIVVNVYAPCGSADRRKLWRELAKIKSNFSGAGWIVAGDFNEVKFKEERKGTSANSMKDMNFFSEFITEMNLTDLPVVGNKFTWFNSNGKCRSRLDRFFVDDTAISMLSLLNQLVGDRDISDHKPVWLKSNYVNWGPKPFRSFNCWFSHKDFIPFVKQSWSSYHVSGSYSNILIKKLSSLKSDLRSWNRNVFGWIDLKIEDNVSNLNSLELDSELISTSNNKVLIKERLRNQEEMWKNLRLKESMLAQKSRLKWLQDGDQNSKLFHDSLKSRYRSNCISDIRVGEGIEEDPEVIKCKTVKYFKERYKTKSSPKFSIDFDHIVC